jgi:hypothetical protein
LKVGSAPVCPWSVIDGAALDGHVNSPSRRLAAVDVFWVSIVVALWENIMRRNFAYHVPVDPEGSLRAVKDGVDGGILDRSPSCSLSVSLIIQISR